MVPGILRQGYDKLADFMKKQAEQPVPGQQPAGGAGGGLASMLGKCTIM
jgi:hypothetical protein